MRPDPLAVALAVVAAWHVAFAAAVRWGPEGGAVAAAVPAAVAALVPLAAVTIWRWWRSPWLWRWTSPGLVLPLLLVDVVVVGSTAVPPAGYLLVFLVTGASEELVARGVAQQLLAGRGPVLRAVLPAALMGLGYAVTLSLLGFGRELTLFVAGMVLAFGCAHGGLRVRGTPVWVLALLGALVVWPQFSEDAFTPLTAVAAVIALVFGVWVAADDPVSRGGSAASARTPPAG